MNGIDLDTNGSYRPLPTGDYDLLDLRTNVLRGMAIPGQQDRDRRLFDLAAEVAKALASREQTQPRQ